VMVIVSRSKGVASEAQVLLSEAVEGAGRLRSMNETIDLK